MKIIKKYTIILFGLLLIAISYNLFFAPNYLDTGGISGLAIVIKHLFFIEESITILIGNLILLTISFIALGKTLTKNSFLGSILLPIFIKLTSNISNIIIIQEIEILILAVIGGVLSGIGYGLLFKNNFTSGGTDILNQIALKKFKIPLNKSMIYIDGSIVLLGGIVFGIETMVYSIISLLIISILSNKTMLELNKNKIFYILTKKSKEIQEYLTKELKYDVTIFETRGGYSKKKKKLILCSVKTKDYYKVKTAIQLIDEEAFITITENYEIMNENKMVSQID